MHYHIHSVETADHLSGFVEDEMERDEARKDGKDQSVEVGLGDVRRNVGNRVVNAAFVQLHHTTLQLSKR